MSFWSWLLGVPAKTGTAREEISRYSVNGLFSVCAEDADFRGLHSYDTNFEFTPDEINQRLWLSLWPRPTHEAEEQIARQNRATDPSDILKLSKKQRAARIQGYEDVYTTTFRDCTCPDFAKRRLPCKHMYALAYELGAFDLPEPESDYIFTPDTAQNETHVIEIDMSEILNGIKWKK